MTSPRKIGLLRQFKARYLLSRQLDGSGRVVAFLEAVKAILWG
jgi:hypothetical protein